MRVEEFDYELPEELIAQEPLEARDASRLLVVDRNAKVFFHRSFTELPHLLAPGDLLVFNDTRVIPARLWGVKTSGGGKIEVLLLNSLDDQRWEALVRPGRRVRPGQLLVFPGGEALEAEIESQTSFGGRVLRFNRRGEELRRIIHTIGEVPLPPYIKAPLHDKERYQTVYARHEGSVAAPTAGLHFTPRLLARLKEEGVKTACLTLHVGLGTFRPVKVENVEDHEMHEEFYRISAGLSLAVKATKEKGGRVIAVGTTAARALESAAQPDGEVKPGEGWTRLFIYPGYNFKVVNGLVTNFHLPRSTLLMLVSAFAGKELILSAYREAVRLRYRFFSFGDAMLII